MNYIDGGYIPERGGVGNGKVAHVDSSDVGGVHQHEDQTGTAESIDQTPETEDSRYMHETHGHLISKRLTFRAAIAIVLVT